MNDLIPPFDFHRIFVEPWTTGFPDRAVVLAVGLIVAMAGALIGNYLVLRRMAMLGDAISHSALPGIVLAFLITGTRDSFALMLGALAAGVITTVLIETIHRSSIVKTDSAIGIVFSMLFATGVILLEWVPHTDLDPDCVLFGQLDYLGIYVSDNVWANLAASPHLRLTGTVFLIEVALLILFYKELLVSSFDPGLASAQGFRPGLIHYGLMGILSLIVVSAFEAVGAILVIAMLILPAATAALLSERLPKMIALSLVHAVLSTVGGMHFALWIDCPTSACMVVFGAFLFLLAWLFHSHGPLRFWYLRISRSTPETPEATSPTP